MPDKRDEPTGKELCETAARLLPHSLKQARAVVDRLRDDPEVKKQIEHFRETQKAFKPIWDEIEKERDKIGW